MSAAAHNLLDQRLAKPLIWSYSLLDNFRTKCNYQGAQRYIFKTTPYKETPEMKYGNDGHTAFEHRVGGGKVLPIEFQRWENFASPFDGFGAKTELKLGVTAQGKSCDFFAKDVWGRGKIDVALVSDTTAFINDWKFGGSPGKPASRYEDPFELEVGAVLLQAKFPQLTKIVGTYTWLKEDHVSKPYDLSDTNKTWAEISSIVRSIENYKAIGEFPKKQTPLCGWCNCACEHNTNPEYAS